MIRFATREWTKEDVDILLDTTIDGGCRLVVHNDEVNTFDWVIKALIEICRHRQSNAPSSFTLKADVWLKKVRKMN